jgi:hypothetical protein
METNSKERLQEDYVKAVLETQITQKNIKEIEYKNLIRLKSCLQEEHYLNGASIAGDPPILVFRLPSKKLIKGLTSKDIRVAVAPCTYELGSCLRFQFWFNEIDRSIVCVHREDPAFSPLECGNFIEVIEHKTKFISAFDVSFLSSENSKLHFSNSWQKVKPHTPIIYDRNAFYYFIFCELFVWKGW